MKVLYDHQMFSIQKYGGISRYFANLYHAFETQYDIEVKLGLLYSSNYYLRNEKFRLPKKLGKAWLKNDQKIYTWNKRYSRHLLKKNDFDVFHPTYYHSYFLPYLKKPFVLTVHDMIYELFPDYFHGNDIYIPFKRELIERANHIIAISESTKRDIIDVFKIDDKKISVVHHGFFDESENDETVYDPPFASYILFVGDRGSYKNFGRFIKAIAPLLLNNDALSLICTGGGCFQGAELELLYRHGIKERAMQISATDQQLKKLYKQALVFVFPSLYEGFGLPLLEAFNKESPVACSNTSCFKEIGGDAVVYFNPYDVEDMRAGIKSVIDDQDFANGLRKKGKEQIKLFPKEKNIQQTKEVYQSLAG